MTRWLETQLAHGKIPGGDQRLFSEEQSKEMWNPVTPQPISEYPAQFAVTQPNFYLYGLGLAMPQAMAGALMPFPERAGAASSLLGFLQQFVASAVGIVVGQTLGASALPLAVVIAVMGVLALVLALIRRSMKP